MGPLEKSSSATGVGGGAVLDRAGVGAGALVARPTTASRQTVSLLTCSKLCGICFVAGIVVGFTLKRRVRRWASKLLKRIRDD